MAAAWIIADHTAEEIAREAADRGLTRVYVTMDTPRDELVFWSLEDAIEYIEKSMPEWIADGLSSTESVGVGEAEVIIDDDPDESSEWLKPTERYWTWDGSHVTAY